MPGIFRHKWALILGGSSGLGLATAHKLSSEGMNLFIVHRDRKSDLDHFENQLTKMRTSGSTVVAFNENATDEGSRKKIIQEIKSTLGNDKIFCLVHSIAKGNLKKLVNEGSQVANKSDFDITIHAMGTNWWEWAKELIDQQLWDADARNLAFTSEGNQKFIPGYVAVSSAKATLEVLGRYMAVELAHMGIKTNVIQSGVVETPSMKMIPDSDKIIELTKKRNPFKRLTQPEDIANTVYLLCLEESKWINGAVIKADGGESLT